MTTTLLAQMDRDAHAAAARHRAGELDETALRHELAELASRSGKAAKAARRFLSANSDPQLRGPGLKTEPYGDRAGAHQRWLQPAANGRGVIS